MTLIGTACQSKKIVSMPTACFEDTLAAILYYMTYGYTRDDVKAKILCKEVLIGKPSLREGESLYLDKDGRYHIESEN